MKAAISVLCLLPLAFGALFSNLLDTTELKNLVNVVVTNFGTDATEQQCESECTTLFKSDILDRGCDFVCLGIQSLIKRFHFA